MLELTCDPDHNSCPQIKYPLKEAIQTISDEPKHQRSCSVKIVTLNTLTLYSTDDLFARAKREAYSLQACENGWAVIGLQETRVRSSKLIEDPRFFMLQNEASQGHGGLEIWLAKRFSEGYSDKR